MWLIATTPDDFKAENVNFQWRTKTNPEKTDTFYSYFIPRRQFGIAKRILSLLEILILQKAFFLAVTVQFTRKIGVNKTVVLKWLL